MWPHIERRKKRRRNSRIQLIHPNKRKIERRKYYDWKTLYGEDGNPKIS